MADDNDNGKGVGPVEVVTGLATGGATALIVPRVTTGRNFNAETGKLSDDAQKRLDKLVETGQVAEVAHADSIEVARKKAFDDAVKNHADKVGTHTIESIEKMDPAAVAALTTDKAFVEEVKTGLGGHATTLSKEAKELEFLTKHDSFDKAKARADVLKKGADVEGSFAHTEKTALEAYLKDKKVPAGVDIATITTVDASKLSGDAKTFVEGAQNSVKSAGTALREESAALDKQLAKYTKAEDFAKAPDRLKALRSTTKEARVAAEGSVEHAELKAFGEFAKDKTELAKKYGANAVKTIDLSKATLPEEEKTFVKGAKEAMEKASGGLKKDVTYLEELAKLAPEYKEAKGFTGVFKKAGIAFKGATTPVKVAIGATTLGVAALGGWAAHAMRSDPEPSQGASR